MFYCIGDALFYTKKPYTLHTLLRVIPTFRGKNGSWGNRPPRSWQKIVSSSAAGDVPEAVSGVDVSGRASSSTFPSLPPSSSGHRRKNRGRLARMAHIDAPSFFCFLSFHLKHWRRNYIISKLAWEQECAESGRESWLSCVSLTVHAWQLAALTKSGYSSACACVCEREWLILLIQV